jgi:regulatory protein YycI of two-component signal transduction system YycFG
MNWGRIKSIFIVAFLILNSFLGYQLWEKQTNKIELAQLYESSLDEFLLPKNITLQTELSVEQPAMSQLNTQFSMYSLGDLTKIKGQSLVIESNQITSQLSQPIPILKPWDHNTFYQEWMAENIVKSDQYILDRVTESEIVYLQELHEYPLFLGSLTFKVEGNQIIGYKQIYYDEVNKGTSQPVISSFTTIRALLDHQVIPAHSTIKSVTLGYYGQVYETESQVLTPVWRVGIEHEETTHLFYVNAFTGALESVPND